ncbi:MAG: insulinase family protein [Candidatus Aegiribacteria sp.]|nr:insulinase family protein [Candidatus Aegiribacteria sp.]
MKNGEFRSEDIRIAQLENGLTVILQEMKYSPVAAVTVAYRIGPLWETQKTRGLSHFCEHMMFKGSEKYGPGKFWQIVQRNGGLANAYTSRDITLYFSAVPIAGLDDILNLESDRMFNCLMNKKEVTSEKKVILEEELLTSRESPEGALDISLYSTAFNTHPYGNSITGTTADIKSFTQKNLTKFYSNFYNPSNAVIAVVGRIDTDSVFNRIKSLFGSESGITTVRPVIPSELPQTGTRRVVIQHPSQLPRISIGFRVPSADKRISSALSLFSIYLASGRSSRFEKLLVKPGLVLDVAASTNTLIQSGLYTIHAVLPPEGSPDEVEEIIFGELERVSNEGISSSEIQRLKKRRIAWSTISDADPLSRSRRLSTGQARFDDPFYFWHSIVNTGRVTTDEIKAAVSGYLVKDNATIAGLKPMGSTAGYNTPSVPAASEEPDLIPPSGLVPSDIDIPDDLLEAPTISVADNSREYLLDNGLRVIMKQDNSFPVISLGFSCTMGSDREPDELTGLSEVTAEAMLYGTPKEDSIRFNSRLENLGSSIDLSSANKYAGGIITVLEKDIDEALSVVADLFRKPAFRGEDINSILRDTIASLCEWTSTPIGAAMDSFSKQSTDPPEKSSVPSVESLSAITRNDIVDFHMEFCRPSGAVITAVGDFNEDNLVDLIRKYFSDWKNPESPLKQTEEVKNAKNSYESSIRLDGREQIAVILGSPAPPKLDHDNYAFHVLNGVLGEGIGSRLGRSIRETGLTYHVSSIYLPFSSRGRLAIILLTSPSAFEEALEKLRNEFSRLVRDPVSRNELRLEKASYIGQQELGMMKYSAIARILLNYASMNLPLDHDRNSLRMIAKLTEIDLQRAAERWFGRGITYLSIAGALNEDLI